jgi:hypothetical protein
LTEASLSANVTKLVPRWVFVLLVKRSTPVDRQRIARLAHLADRRR